MKEFKYTINGKEYQVEIESVNEDTNIASLKVNGEAYEVGMEKTAEDEKKKVVLGKPAQEEADKEAAPVTNVNTAQLQVSALRWAKKFRPAILLLFWKL